MRKINITLIFILIGVFLRAGFGYTADTLRVPVGIENRAGFMRKQFPLNLALNKELFLVGKKILMVQDCPDAVFLNKRYCTKRGANEKDIIIAGDYETAIRALDSDKFDAIILDMGFPIKEGGIEEDWAGLSVFEYIVTNSMIVSVLIDSNKVCEDLSIIHKKISENSEKYPNLAKLDRKIEAFLGIFPLQFSPNKRNDDHFRSLLEIDLEGLRVSL